MVPAEREFCRYNYDPVSVKSTFMTAESQPVSRLVENQVFSSPAKRTFLCSLLLVLLTLAVYNPVVHNGFINLDDTLYITDNAHVKAGPDWTGVKYGFTTFDQANWHPLTWLAFELDWHFFGKNAAGHHYTSLLLHALDVVLLFLLFQSATGHTWRSLAVAALFAVHPSNVESVAWASELKNPLSMAFFLLAMLAYGWYARQPSIRRYLPIPLLFALGLMAKPQIIALPFVLLLWDYWPLRRFGWARKKENENEISLRPASFRQLLLEKVPLLALAAADAVITIRAQHAGDAVRTVSEYSLGLRVANAIVAYTRYVAHALWPYHLSPIYSHRPSIPAWQVVLALLCLLGLTGLILRSGKSYLLSGWLWFLGNLVPVIGLVQVGDLAMAEHYAYIPFIGLFWMATWFLAEGAETWRFDARWLAIPACLVIATCSLVSRQLLVYWHDSETLWSYAVRIDDQDFMAHQNLGKILVGENRPKEAIPQFIIAEHLHHYSVANVVSLTSYELEHGDIEDAKAQCFEALQNTNDPHVRAVALNNLGVAALILGDLPAAKVHFNEAVKSDPGHAWSIIGLGLIAYREGDVSAAINYFSKAVSLEPNNSFGHLLLSVAYEKSGREAEARSAYATAAKGTPDMRFMVNWVNQLLGKSTS